MSIQKLTRKKELGAFYTPIHTVDFMLNLLGKIDKKANFLEPSGGDGVFVSRLLKKFEIQLTPLSNETAGQGNSKKVQIKILFCSMKKNQMNKMMTNE